MSKFNEPATQWQCSIHSALMLVLIFIVVITMNSFAAKGKRNTYCDHLRHLVVDHKADFTLPDECLRDETDIRSFLREAGYDGF